MITYPKYSVELKEHFIFLGAGTSVGKVKRSNAEAPFKKVKVAMNIRKFPILSAIIPANGGPNMSATGITLLTMEASSIVNPNERICKEIYGYNVTRLAD